jgi:hypothetical protein
LSAAGGGGGDLVVVGGLRLGHDDGSRTCGGVAAVVGRHVVHGVGGRLGVSIVTASVRSPSR